MHEFTKMSNSASYHPLTLPLPILTSHPSPLTLSSHFSPLPRLPSYFSLPLSLFPLSTHFAPPPLSLCPLTFHSSPVTFSLSSFTLHPHFLPLQSHVSLSLFTPSHFAPSVFIPPLNPYKRPMNLADMIIYSSFL